MTSISTALVTALKGANIQLDNQGDKFVSQTPSKSVVFNGLKKDRFGDEHLMFIPARPVKKQAPNTGTRLTESHCFICGQEGHTDRYCSFKR